MRHRWVTGDLLPIVCLFALAGLLVRGPEIYDYLLPAAVPELHVTNPKGRDSAGGDVHWVADWCYFDIHYRNSRRSAWPYELSMDAQADPADPYGSCFVALVGPGKTVQRLTFRDHQVLRFSVLIGPGRNRFAFWVLWPDRAPGDAGGQMLRISSLRFTPAEARRP